MIFLMIFDAWKESKTKAIIWIFLLFVMAPILGMFLAHCLNKLMETPPPGAPRHFVEDNK